MTKWFDPLDLFYRKRLLDMLYIDPRGVREGTALIFFGKSVFEKHPSGGTDEPFDDQEDGDGGNDDDGNSWLTMRQIGLILKERVTCYHLHRCIHIILNILASASATLFTSSYQTEDCTKGKAKGDMISARVELDPTVIKLFPILLCIKSNLKSHRNKIINDLALKVLDFSLKLFQFKYLL